MKRVASIFAGAVVVGMGIVPPAQAESLTEALVNAYANNPTLEARRARLRATDETVSQAVSAWRPTVTSRAQGGIERVETNARRDPETLQPRTLSLSVSQPVYRGGRIQAGIEGAENTVMSERASLQSAEQQILLNSITAYTNVVRDQAVLELNRNNEQVLTRQLEATRDRFRVGEITMTDVSQAEARLSGSVADRVAAEGNLQASSAAYQNVVGHSPEKLTPPGVSKSLPATRDEALAMARERNPNVVSADYSARAANNGVTVAEADLLPSVSLNGDLSRAEESSQNGIHSTTASAMVAVAIPIYQTGAEYSRIRQQKQTAGQRRIEVEQARRDAIEATNAAWETFLSAKARAVSYRAQIRAAQIALEGVEREAQVGSRTVLDVLNAEQELLNARVNLVRAERDETVTSYQLLSATGQLTAASLGLPVDVYDPAGHYSQVRNKWVGTSVPQDKQKKTQ